MEIEIDANSIDTKDETRDAHMLQRFFGVEDHPTISFRTAVRPGDGENEWKVDGELTIKGTTRPVTVDVEFPAAPSTSVVQRIGFSGWSPRSTGGSGDWSGTPLRQAGSCWPTTSAWRSRPSSSRSKQVSWS